MTTVTHVEQVILVAFGDLRQKYPKVAAQRFQRAERITAALAKHLPHLPNTTFIHGGRKNTLSTKMLKQLSAKHQMQMVQTYLPKCEIDRSARMDKFEHIGVTLEVSDYIEERREKMVNDSDLVLISDGNRGVSHLLQLAQQRKKKILPLPFGFERNALFRIACESFHKQLKRNNANNLVSHWNTINALNASENQVAAAIFRLIKAYSKKEICRSVFVTIPLIAESKLITTQVIRVIRDISENFGFIPIIVKDTTSQKPLIDEIIDGMDESIALISVLDYNRPNIYLETGYMKGQGKPVLMCCHSDNFKNVAFDALAYEIIVWKTARDLKNALTAKFNSLLKNKLLTF